MSSETLSKVLERYFETDQPVYSMVWQGGEPTVMGRDFFAQVVDLQKKTAPRGAQISNSIQTNATLIKEDLAELLGKYKFLAGCSIDGPADLHDRHRRTITKHGSHKKTLQGIQTLQKNGVPVNGVVLVSAANVAHPEIVYRYLISQGIRHIQFIPCVETDDNGRPKSFSINGRQWGEFLLTVFNEWYKSHLETVSIRNFESVLARIAGVTDTECRLCEKCDQYLVVEHNGDVYPCDFYVEHSMLLGNVAEMSFADMINSKTYQAFMNRKKNIHDSCSNCRHFSLCMGDCPKFRTNPEDGISLLCEGWNMFYNSTTDKFKNLVISAGYTIRI